MSSLDIIITIVVGIGVLWGVKSGIVRQVLGIAGLVASIVLGFLYMEPVGAMVASLLTIEGNMAVLAGFGSVFLAVQLGFTIIIRIIQKMIGVLKLGLVDRMVGGVVGGFSASLFLSILFWFMLGMGVPAPTAQESSRFYSPVSEILPGAWDYAAKAFPDLEGLPERFGLDLDQPSDL